MNWIIAGGMMLAAGGLFISLLMLGLAQASARADREWRLDRIERKLDLVLTHLGIAHDDQIPDAVVELLRDGRTTEAIEAYRAATGSNPKVARREIEWLRARITASKTPQSPAEP